MDIETIRSMMDEEGRVVGDLDLEGCTGITALPEGLTVGGYLDLRGTGITALPEGLTVGGSLDLEGCTGITALPEGLTVGGYLDLRGTGITAMAAARDARDTQAAKLREMATPNWGEV